MNKPHICNLSKSHKGDCEICSPCKKFQKKTKFKSVKTYAKTLGINLDWTTNAPTENGYYWFIDMTWIDSVPARETQIVEVYNEGVRFFEITGYLPIKELSGYWSQKITMPKISKELQENIDKGIAI